MGKMEKVYNFGPHGRGDVDEHGGPVRGCVGNRLGKNLASRTFPVLTLRFNLYYYFFCRLFSSAPICQLFFPTLHPPSDVSIISINSVVSLL